MFALPRLLAPSDADAVVEVNDTSSELAFVENFKLHADVVGQGALVASDHDRAQEQMELIDQPIFGATTAARRCRRDGRTDRVRRLRSLATEQKSFCSETNLASSGLVGRIDELRGMVKTRVQVRLACGDTGGGAAPQ